MAKQPDYRRVRHESSSYRSDRRRGRSARGVHHRDDVAIAANSVGVIVGDALRASEHGPPASTTPHAPTAPAGPTGVPASTPNVTDPWAVVSAYYGDIESGNYPEAWALIGSGATTGQTYQQFVSGFACTGGQDLTEAGQSGDQVTFDLAATDSCTGQVHDFTGTDTVQNGMIVGAHVVQTG